MSSASNCEEQLPPESPLDVLSRVATMVEKSQTSPASAAAARRLCHRCTPPRETASQDCTLWQRISLSYLLLGLTFCQKLQLGCFFIILIV